MTLESQRVRLRPIAEDDLVKFVIWFNDPEITDNLALHLPVTEIGEQEWLKTLRTTRVGTDIVLVIELKEPQPLPIGTIGIHKIDHKNANAEISFVIGEKKFWGQGLVGEAARLALSYGFDELDLHRFYSGAYAFNKQSIRALTKLGFAQEGIQRDAVFKKGAYHDTVMFAMLRADWNKVCSKAH